MFAVIRTGGKQHRVTENDRIVIERLPAEPGATIAFDKVLMLAGGEGTPLIGDAVPGAARVFGQVLEQKRGEKIIVFKKKRRQGYRRKRGHRQYQTVVRIMSISASGEEPNLEAMTADIAAAPPPVADTVAESVAEDVATMEPPVDAPLAAEADAPTAHPGEDAATSGEAPETPSETPLEAAPDDTKKE